MFTVKDRKKSRHSVKRRVRRKVSGTAERPRLCVFRSSKHIYAQAVDDTSGRTLAAASTLDKEVRADSGAAYGGNVEAAKRTGERIARILKSKGLEAVVFDRSGYIYHGRVKALAEAAREHGLKF